MSEEDSVFFTIPLLGLFSFSKNQYLLLNIGVIFLFLHLVGKEKNLRWKGIFRQSGVLVGMSLCLVLIGELIAWICAVSVGARFKWFGTVSGIPFDNAVIVSSLLLLIIGLVRYFRIRPDVLQNLYASLFTLGVWSLLALFIVGVDCHLFIRKGVE